MRVLAGARVVASAREAGRPGSRVRAARLTGRGSRGMSLIRDTVAQQMLRGAAGRPPGIDLALRLRPHASPVPAQPHAARVPGLPPPGVVPEPAPPDAPG